MTRDGNNTGTLRPAAVNLSPLNVAATDLGALQEKLLATARTAHAHRAADTVYTCDLSPDYVEINKE